MAGWSFLHASGDSLVGDGVSQVARDPSPDRAGPDLGQLAVLQTGLQERWALRASPGAAYRVGVPQAFPSLLAFKLNTNSDHKNILSPFADF